MPLPPRMVIGCTNSRLKNCWVSDVSRSRFRFGSDGYETVRFRTNAFEFVKKVNRSE